MNPETESSTAASASSSRVVLGTTRGARLQLGKTDARGLEGGHIPSQFAVALGDGIGGNADEKDTSPASTAFFIAPPQWTAGRLVDELVNLVDSAKQRVTFGLPTPIPAGYTPLRERQLSGRFGAFEVMWDGAAKRVFLRRLDLTKPLHDAFPTDALLFVALLEASHVLEGATRDDAAAPTVSAELHARLLKALQRSAPLSFFQKQKQQAGGEKASPATAVDDDPTGGDDAGVLAEQPTAPSPTAAEDFGELTPFIADDGDGTASLAGAVPSLLTVPFAASKMKALAAKDAGTSSVVIAVYAAPQGGALSAACFRAALSWPVGKFLDVILEHFPTKPSAPLVLGAGDERLRLVHLRQFRVLDGTLKVGDALSNGDAIYVSPGGHIPRSMAIEARTVVHQQSAKTLPTPAKLKIQKDCVVM